MRGQNPPPYCSNLRISRQVLQPRVALVAGANGRATVAGRYAALNGGGWLQDQGHRALLWCVAWRALVGACSCGAEAGPGSGIKVKSVDKLKKNHGITTYARFPDAELDDVVRQFIGSSPAVGPEDGYRQARAHARAEAAPVTVAC